MVAEAFSIPTHQFMVFQADDGTTSWNGSYQGMKLLAAWPIDSARCLILLDWMATKQNVFENLLCVDRSGKGGP